jgi:membrane-associated phospholipid phosphatase
MGILAADNTISLALYRWGTADPTRQNLFLLAGSVFVYLLPLVLLWLFFQSQADRLKSVKIFLAAILGWQVLSNALGTWLYSVYAFRDRPFAVDGIQELFFEQPEKAFPSDHAVAMLAVSFACFGYKYPKLGWLFLVGGLLSSLARVTVGFHYVGDVLAALPVAALAYLIIRLLDRHLDRVIPPLVAWMPVRGVKKDDQ